MKKRLSRYVAVVAVAGVMLCMASVRAAEEGQMPQRPAELKNLEPFAGEWTGAGMMMAPDGTSHTVKVEHKSEWVLNNFYLMGKERFIEGPKFESISIAGYDQGRKRYVSVGASTMNSGPIVSYGTYDEAAKAFRYDFSMVESQVGEIKGRVVVKWTEPGKRYTVDVYVMVAGVPEMHVARMEYEKKA